MTPARFAAFAEPGWGRIAANFSVRHYGTPRTLISYEARTATGDPQSARRFGRYWIVVRPFVRSIMRGGVSVYREHAGKTVQCRDLCTAATRCARSTEMASVDVQGLIIRSGLLCSTSRRRW